MKRGLEIAFFGSSLVSAYWNGAATYYRGIIRALAERGHRVTFYEPDAFGRQQHRDIADPKWARVVVYPADADSVVRCLRQARASDLLVKASGVGVFDELLEAEVLAQRTPSNQVVFWDVDAPATLERLTAPPAEPFRPLVSQYDLIFTYGGGEPVVRAYRRFGAKRCVPIYNALDPTTHFPVSAEARFACDLAFLGNRLPDREARVEEFFFAAARRVPQSSFLLGGNGWQDHPLPKNVRYLGHVYTRDHNALNCTAKAVLNVSRSSMARFGFSPATRVFEAAGAGACILTDDWEGIGQFLEPGAEILVAGDGAAVADLLQATSTSQAKLLGAAARRRILAEHTYAHRAAAVEAALGIAAPLQQIA